ncbi:hypothetical protein GO988_17470 [Hymenobacter sp. HMF4947]|uniref:Uncharacterized protein n=1 Tax=Hymenobacter ginkgonis TaxID=2682976 RepID=A0A7K1TIW6_9BACT|nr:hypothetical protein [Hymenobacter ginkgonis]MVN78121.1 hypothetical protein [Hymenobacter ginkgonis]
MPDWDGIDDYPEVATVGTLASSLHEEEPWETYNQAVKQLIGEQAFKSTVDGHPAWVQGGATPVDAARQRLPLLFQIDSKDEAGIMLCEATQVWSTFSTTRNR